MADTATETTATTETASAASTAGETTTEQTQTGTLLGGKPATEVSAEGTADTAKGDEQTAKPDAKPQGAPEKYETFTMPEGITLDTAALAEFEPIARELNLTQEQAQKLVNLEAGRMANYQKTQAEAWGKQISDWGEAVKADPTLGGENLPTTLKSAGVFMEWLGMPELKALMDIATPENPTGLGIGNHPVLVAAFAKAGKAMGEDAFHTANGGEGKSDKPLGQKFYPGMNP